VTAPQTEHCPDLLAQIPDADTVRGWLAESVRRSDLLRSLLRLAVRRDAYLRPAGREEREVCRAE
jgi:hypothetical protein